ncbi:type II toxin-antitoxin system HicA family toxin [Xenophilus sp. Marseille-Q4582]|uniref:type II toxin-antitoxin system HicA family toxin n=1 Tax=Xenophilus sp. Marseille-Q4582 TaxID=2866600 RepID=UPI001CE3FD0C|nr:type II toxin-antitoxin system HicA family toxin [Xenophilus sp. Marseille-Q4582]
MRSYYPQVIAMLKEHGFSFDGAGKGSHEFYRKGAIRVMVSYNCYSRHTANGIMRDAGITHKF